MKLTNTLSFLLLFSLLFFGCGHQNDDSVELTGEFQIDLQTISGNTDGRISQALLDDADAILLTIESADGSSTDYSLTEINLYQIDGTYISQKITLPVGNYNITEFLVIDSDDNIVYITPLEGSSQAQNVSNPLPISFSIAANEITEIEIEVISTEELSLEDFGLAGFNLSEVNLFSFLINVSEKGNLELLLDAEVTVSSGSFSFSKELLAIANNSLVIKDGFSSYELTIQHEGYEAYNYTFSRDSLEFYASMPLTIELVPNEVELSIQERLDNGETPISLYNSGIEVNELYGANYSGGIISYLNTDTGTGFVSAKMDQATNIEWGCSDIEISGDQGTSYTGERNLVGGGALNTPEIVIDCNEDNSAAKICSDLVLEGYDDWYLPAREELEIMYTNLHINGLGDFLNEDYWSSNEIDSGINPPLIRVIDFSDGTGGGTRKTQLYSVRAIRYF